MDSDSESLSAANFFLATVYRFRLRIAAIAVVCLAFGVVGIVLQRVSDKDVVFGAAVAFFVYITFESADWRMAYLLLRSHEARVSDLDGPREVDHE